MDLDLVMTQGNWNNVVDEISESLQAAKRSGLTQGERHQEIVRKKLLDGLKKSTTPIMKGGESYLYALGSEIDEMTDAIVKNQQKDGLDLDNDLLELLIHMSGKIHAIQVNWKEISDTLKQS